MPRLPARATSLALTTIVVSIAIEACTTTEALNEPPPAPSPPILTGSDASSAEPEAGLIQYCPSSECPTGRTTCPTSRFLCDVDLRVDRDNCGACGHGCPPPRDGESYECIEGRCELRCPIEPPAFDCDGIPENGCETIPGTNEHCSGCNKKCLDPAKRCMAQYPSGYECGCPDGMTDCGDSICTDTSSDDQHCGACGNVCDPNGGPPRPNAFYGCVKGKCGRLKCERNFGNCDLDDTNGCETRLTTKDDCGVCGNACAEGQVCALDNYGFPSCACPAGQTFCGLCSDDTCSGGCFDTATDPDNCGACGVRCPRRDDISGDRPVCSYGTCALECMVGRADCNGDGSDGCEVDSASDPKNCGACGRVCDGIAGQACVGGRCVVEPCASDAGAGETR